MPQERGTYYTKPLNVVLVGDQSVGKSTLVAKCHEFNPTISEAGYFTKDFETPTKPTSIRCHPTNIYVASKNMTATLYCVFTSNIIDTGGARRYDNIRPLAYMGADVFLVCFDITNRKSFENVTSRWITEIRKYELTPPVILIGTKADLELQRQVGIDEAKRLATTLRSKNDYFEVSYEDDDGIKALFSDAVFCGHRQGLLLSKTRTRFHQTLEEESYDLRNLEPPSYPPEYPKDSSTLSTDWQKTLRLNAVSDVIIKCEDDSHDIHAHIFVLSLASEAFRKLFSSLHSNSYRNDRDEQNFLEKISDQWYEKDVPFGKVQCSQCGSSMYKDCASNQQHKLCIVLEKTIKHKTFLSIINWMYTGHLIFMEEGNEEIEMDDFQIVARKLEMKALKELCRQHKRLSASTLNLPQLLARIREQVMEAPPVPPPLPPLLPSARLHDLLPPTPPPLLPLLPSARLHDLLPPTPPPLLPLLPSAGVHNQAMGLLPPVPPPLPPLLPSARVHDLLPPVPPPPPPLLPSARVHDLLPPVPPPPPALLPSARVHNLPPVPPPLPPLLPSARVHDLLPPVPPPPPALLPSARVHNLPPVPPPLPPLLPSARVHDLLPPVPPPLPPLLPSARIHDLLPPVPPPPPALLPSARIHDLLPPVPPPLPPLLPSARIHDEAISLPPEHFYQVMWKDAFLCSDFLTDLELSVKDTLIAVHRVVLITRSPVMAAMLEGKFKEKDHCKVTLHGVPLKHFLSVLEFLYTDTCCLDATNVYHVLELADRFLIESLVQRCEEYVIQTLEDTEFVDQVQVDTVMEALCYSKAFNASCLHKWCLHFIATNYELFETQHDFKLIWNENKDFMDSNRWPPNSRMKVLNEYKMKARMRTIARTCTKTVKCTTCCVM